IEHPGAHEPSGLFARVVQRILALNAAVWHNWTTGAHVKRSLIAYDH
ncbi:MAG TPA: IS982 family transposase, partial [Amycolatopsis sp.]|nr:IS982 family transposase [Amycolatopsis sp.]